MNTKIDWSSNRWSKGLFILLLVCLLTAIPSGNAAEPEAATEPEEEPYDPTAYSNWVDASVGGVLVDGDEAQMQQRLQKPDGAYGGIDEFHWEKFVGESGILKIDGRGLLELHNYRLQIQYEDPERGFVRAGYREFRTWYDATGGWFPLTDLSFPIFDDDLSIDRGEVWFETGLTLPDKPILTFEYRHVFREGKKGSTIWGDATMTGAPLPPGSNARAIVPSFWEMDEERDIFAADIKHGIKGTDFKAGIRYEIGDIDNSRNMRRRPGEASDRFLTQEEKTETDMLNVHALTETRLHEKLLFTTGYSFTTLDTGIGGSRIYGADLEPVFDPLFARRQRFDEGFLNLSGGSQWHQHVVNLNLLATPWDSFAIVPAIRIEKGDVDGFSRFIETNVQPSGAPPVLTTLQEPLAAFQQRSFLDVSESLEMRYAGFTNWVLYARGFWLQGEGDLEEEEFDLGVTPRNRLLLRDSDDERFTQKYTVGANWYPLRRLNFGFQYYHKNRENEYDHKADSTGNASGNRYPAFLTDQDFETDDVNFRATWRILNNLTLVGRYDLQYSTIETEGAGLDQIESAEMVSHILSASLSWSPLARLYLQGTVNYVWDQTQIPAKDLIGDAANLVLESENDYWNATFTAGLALNDRTDLEASYYYYRADNFQDNSLFSQPFGAEAEDHGITAGLVRRIKSNIRWNLKYGFFTHHDVTFGGQNDFDAHLLYSSLRWFF